ncbi:ABC transporter, permease protein [[Clostridium] methylpentosum DSM 5476]|uniref:ABC transporter, permease protein n=1 Tax=[Clostridium] methylpentosum DSM 5476 TaxID=537013 RepID=C0EHY0_9FIRM|nr:ABC transporter, permease protein [[Clostridium] methylpentosum DSM 5476]MDY3988611.1 amino acid ABC transporter permease [Massilioclostridium sp.]MEE1492924.1 amino acid ABC transporter permease [Massilioclostridium sp.]
MQSSGIQVLFEGANLSRLLGGLWVTLQIALISIAISAVLGVLFGIVMTSKSRVVRAVCRIYLEAVRIIPILVWLFIFYFGVTKALNIHLSGMFVSVLVFSLWGTAEMGDIVRGAVQSLPLHQREAGRAIGLTELQVYRYIIIPQAVRRLLPAAINLATRMIKTTSLVVIIGVVEVVKVGQQIIESNILNFPTASLWVYGLIFLLYFIICYPISLFSKRLETRWQS